MTLLKPYPISQRRKWSAASAFFAIALGLFFLAGVRAGAAPITREQALEAAYAWAHLSPEAMHKQHGQLAGTVFPLQNALGITNAYAVDLTPKGYVIISADDDLEPVIAFSATDNFQPAPGNPLFELVNRDVPARLARTRAGHPAAPGKWKKLRAISNAPLVLAPKAAASAPSGSSVTSVSDVRVAPLIQSLWDQQLSGANQPVFNYYTPPYASGNANNYYCGCVATMLAQIMRYYQWPQAGVGTASYQITVNGRPAQRSLRGGDGAGGSYSWANMPLVASSNLPATQQQAIGALMSDAGVASNMDYESDGSAAYVSATVLTQVFGYANAAYSDANLSTLEVAMQANLDAGMPVGLGIANNVDGHAIVTDGYGYNAGTLYHHLNMGWSGAYDAWYNLPTIDAGGGSYDFDIIEDAIFNIDPKVTGEIMSGRIVDNSGNPVQGSVISVSSGPVTVTATTNAVGIFAVKGLASNTTWTVTPAAGAMVFSPSSLTVTTGQSSPVDGMGDVTGLNFTSNFAGAVTVQINPGAVASGAQWRMNGGAWQDSGVTVAGVPAGTGTLSFKAISNWTAPANELVTVNVSGTTSAEAAYQPKYALAAAPNKSAYGQVLANPAPGDLNYYAPNTSVTLTATAATGYYFEGWTENGTLISTNPSYTSVVTGVRSLVADFSPNTLTGQNTQVYVTNNTGSQVIDVLANLIDSIGTPVIISVTQPANGTVTINSNGTLSFVPGAGFHGNAQFSYVAGDGNGGTITKTVTISNWFAASAGTYSGLSLATDVTNETSGYLRVSVTSSGALTGRFSQAGINYPVSGSFDANGNFVNVIARKNASSLNLALHLVPATEISGTVSDGVTSSVLTANRLTFNAANKAPQAGTYTVLLEGNEAVPGNGYLLVTVNTSGWATAAGRLGDGTPVSLSAYLNADGSLPFYTGIYQSTAGAGSLLGTITLQPNATPQCSGEYAWFRPAAKAGNYRAGFAEAGDITGSPVPAPAAKGALESSAEGAITVVLSGGGLADPISETGQLRTTGKIDISTLNPEFLTLSVGASGQINGSFIDPVTHQQGYVLGAWLSNQQLGGGFFIVGGAVGAVTISE